MLLSAIIKRREDQKSPGDMEGCIDLAYPGPFLNIVPADFFFKVTSI